MLSININNKINSTQCGFNIVTLIQDTIIGMYIITMDDTYVERDVFWDLCMRIDFTDLEEFFTRARKFYKIPKNYKKIHGRIAASILFDKLFCYSKGNLQIENGIIIKGTFDKSTLGSSKNSIIHKISIEYSSETAADFITKTSWFANQWNLHHGFTFGIMDCMTTRGADVKQAIDKAQQHINYIHSTNKTDVEKESLIIEALMNVNTIGQKIAKDGMIGGNKNAMSLATLSGARGNFDNLMSISCVVGLQTVGGKRMESMLCEGTRVLPCFRRHDQRLAANSFIMHNYLNGLNPVECFYTAWATRDGICNTALTTAQSGYGHRRFEKKMENCKTCMDGTIRDCNGKIVDFYYGEYNYSGTMVYFVDDIPFCVDPLSICKMCNLEYVGKNPQTFTLDKTQIDKILSRLYFKTVNTKASRYNKLRTCEFLRKKLSQCQIIAEPKIVKKFINKIIEYHNRAVVPSGEMVGGKASNAMGEDSTQGALSSFHNTGRLTKSVVTGLPRLLEIINLTDELTVTSMSFNTITPGQLTEKECFYYVYGLRKYFECRYISDFAELSIENINGSTNKYERLLNIVTDHQIPDWVELYCNLNDIDQPTYDGFVIVIDVKLSELYKYRITLHEIVECIKSDEYIAIPSPPGLHKIYIYPDYENIPKKYNQVGAKSWKYYYTRDYILKNLSTRKITGIDGISSIFFAGFTHNKTRDGKHYTSIKIDVQGNNFSEMSMNKYVVFNTLETDVIYEIYNNLGIGATYTFLYSELCKVFSKPILPCNIMLLARSMTRDGIPTNVSRHGINDDVGIVTKMMNETVMEIITNGASSGSNDLYNSVAASYVLGNLGQYGTNDNSFQLIRKK